MASKLKAIAPRVQQISLTRAPAMPEQYGQGRGGRPWRRLRASILIRDGYACQVVEHGTKCGRVSPDNEVDHIDNRRGEGYDDPSNLQTICVDHHRAKTALESRGAQS